MKVLAQYSHGSVEQLARKYAHDAGIDIPVSDVVVIAPHKTKAIPTGLRISLPAGTMAMLIARSSVAKQGVHVHMSPIDSGYEGEIHVIVSNLTPNNVFFNKGDRIAQLVVTQTVLVELVSDLGSNRGSGGLGSTGR